MRSQREWAVNRLWYRAFVLERGWLKRFGRFAPEGEPKNFCPWFRQMVAAILVYGLLFKGVGGPIRVIAMFVWSTLCFWGRLFRALGRFLRGLVPPAKFWQATYAIGAVAFFVFSTYELTDFLGERSLHTPPVLVPHQLDVEYEQRLAFEEWDLEYQLRDRLSVQFHRWGSSLVGFEEYQHAYDQWQKLDHLGSLSYSQQWEIWRRVWENARAWAVAEYRPSPEPEPAVVLQVAAVREPFVDMEKLKAFPGKATEIAAGVGARLGPFLLVGGFWLLVAITAAASIWFSYWGVVKGVRRGWELILALFVFAVWIWDWPGGRAINWLLKFVFEMIPQTIRSAWQQIKFLACGLWTRHHDMVCPPLEWEGEWKKRQ